MVNAKQAAEIAQKYIGEYEIINAGKYKDKFIFTFGLPNVDPNKPENALIDNIIVIDSNGNYYSFNWIDDMDMLEKMTALPGETWGKKSLEHHGRKGMKWYEHIFGDEDSRAKYNRGSSNSSKDDISGMGMRLDSSRRAADSDLLSSKGIGLPGFDVMYGDINPGFQQTQMPSYRNNCVYCTTAYDLQRRGYKVTAAPAMGFKCLDIGKFYKGGKEAMQVCATDYLGDLGDESRNIRRNQQAALNAMTQTPVGARGNFCAQGLPGGSGHSMAWEHMSDGVHIIDAQIGRELNSQEAMSYINRGKWFNVLRTDNLEIDDDTIDECIESDSDARARRMRRSINDDFWSDIPGSNFMVPEKVYLEHQKNRPQMYLAMINPDSTDIQHYGVKGMKWGRTKPENRSEHGGGGFTKKKTGKGGLDNEMGDILKGLHQSNTIPNPLRNQGGGGGGGAVEEEEDEDDKNVNEFSKLLSGLNQPNTIPNPLLKDKVDKSVSKTDTSSSSEKKKGSSFVSKVLNGLKKLNSVTTNYNKHELGEDSYAKWLPKKKQK